MEREEWKEGKGKVREERGRGETNMQREPLVGVTHQGRLSTISNVTPLINIRIPPYTDYNMKFIHE